MQFAGTKLKGPDRNTLAHELAALANSDGGVLVLGVDDKSHGIAGIPEDRERAIVQVQMRRGLFVHRNIRPAGRGRTYQLDAADIAGPLDMQVDPGPFMLIPGSKRLCAAITPARLPPACDSALRYVHFDMYTIGNGGHR